MSNRQESKHQSEENKSLGFLGFNKEINKKLESLKSSAPDFNNYISEKIKESQDEIKKLEGVFPGFLESYNSSMEENKSFFKSMLDSSLHAKKLDVSEFIPKLSEDYRDAINDILLDKGAMELKNQDWLESFLEPSERIVQNIQNNQDIMNLLGVAGIDLDSLPNEFA